MVRVFNADNSHVALGTSPGTRSVSECRVLGAKRIQIMIRFWRLNDALADASRSRYMGEAATLFKKLRLLARFNHL